MPRNGAAPRPSERSFQAQELQEIVLAAPRNERSDLRMQYAHGRAVSMRPCERVITKTAEAGPRTRARGRRGKNAHERWPKCLCAGARYPSENADMIIGRRIRSARWKAEHLCRETADQDMGGLSSRPFSALVWACARRAGIWAMEQAESRPPSERGARGRRQPPFRRKSTAFCGSAERR